MAYAMVRRWDRVSRRWMGAGAIATMFVASACGPSDADDDACLGECGEDPTAEGSGSESGGDPQTTGEPGTTGDPQTTGEPDTTGGEAVTLEACMQETGIALDCGPDSRFQYVAFGDTLGCGGLASYSQDEVFRFAYSLAEMIDDDFPVRELRVYAPGEGGDRFVAIAPAPILLWSLTAVVSDWAGEVHALPAGFFDVVGGVAGVTLDPVPEAMDFELMEEVFVTGSFSLAGGSVVSLGSEIDDPTVQVVGCFAAPAETHAMELDE